MDNSFHTETLKTPHQLSSLIVALGCVNNLLLYFLLFKQFNIHHFIYLHQDTIIKHGDKSASMRATLAYFSAYFTILRWHEQAQRTAKASKIFAVNAESFCCAVTTKDVKKIVFGN